MRTFSTNQQRYTSKNIEIDLQLVEQLERISLVKFNNETGLKWLKDSVRSANQLLQVNTEGVEPFYSFLEDRQLWLREDKVTDGNCADEILMNATKTEEGYFVAPPGNVPLQKRDMNVLDLNNCNEEIKS